MAQKQLIRKPDQETSLTRKVTGYLTNEFQLYGEGFAIITAPARQALANVFNRVTGRQRYLDRGLTVPPGHKGAAYAGAGTGAIVSLIALTSAAPLMVSLGPVPALAIATTIYWGSVFGGALGATQWLSKRDARAHYQAQARLADERQAVAALPDDRKKPQP